MQNRILLSATVGLAVLISAAPAMSEVWEFDKPIVRDINGVNVDGWTRDKVTRQSRRNDTIGRANFATGTRQLSLRNDRNGDKILVVTSSDRVIGTPDSRMDGGGIERDGVYKRRVSSRCRVVGTDDEMRRGAAAVWIPAARAKPSLELDMLEMKSQGVHMTFASWDNSGRIRPTDNGSPSKSCIWLNNDAGNNACQVSLRGSAADERRLASYNDVRSWGVYRCARNRDGSTHNCQRNLRGQRVRHSISALPGATVEEKMVIHNKPWRFLTGAIGEGPVAKLECDWVRN